MQRWILLTTFSISQALVSHVTSHWFSWSYYSYYQTLVTIFYFLVHNRAVSIEIYKEGMKTEVKHVKKWV